MIEFSTPAAPERPDLRNVSDLLASRAAAAPDHVAFQLPDGGAWRDVTTREFEDTVIAVAKGMVATGVEPGDTVAVGDQRNDLEMLQWAARGVAMGNAPDEVKAVADEVTLSVTDDGLVPILRSLVP